jgi:hypothetical protein
MMNLKALPFPALALALVLTACAAGVDDPQAGGGAPADSAVQADEVEVVTGVPDHGRDPAVVALDIGEVALCTASLIAPDVLLTARHCVSRTSESVECPATMPQVTANRAPSSLKVLVGDDVGASREVAQGKAVLVPPGDTLCDADIALVVLDRPVTGVEPLVVSKGGIAKGGHVTAVGYGKRGDDGAAGQKLLRSHVKVLATSDKEFLVGEATCQGDSGGPAIDESSGDIVGVVSRGGPSCAGAGVHNVYTRVDAFLPLVVQALARSSAGAPSPTKKGPSAPSDLGTACTSGGDCATGVCVMAGSQQQYCSRPCDAADRCPTRFRCAGTSDGKPVCVEH